VEHSKADARPVAGCGAPGDDSARFLHELRQLRNGAGLGHAELAARAHYPFDSIRAAEVGPSLPDLPVLSAFVRACGGTTEEWEERWRSLTKSPSLPISGARQAHRSDAADAGARINSATQAEDSPDPSIILAALNRVAEEMAASGADQAPAPPAALSTPDFPAPPPVPSDPPGAGGQSAWAPVAPSTPDFPPPSPLPPGAPGAGGRGGWDPIRVSSAWPALKSTPTVAEPAGNAASLGGAGVPWDDAARGEGQPGTALGGRPVPGAGAPGSTGRSARTMLVVIAVVVLCVIVALVALLA
jgi:hypothetical protein